MNKLVARFADGRLVKGVAFDFSLAREVFHITEPAPNLGTNPTAIRIEDLKALFFVKDFDGDAGHVDKLEFDSPPLPWERRVGVKFNDGETLLGTTPRYRAAKEGFFLVPADTESNNERCYVVEAATQEIRFF